MKNCNTTIPIANGAARNAGVDGVFKQFVVFFFFIYLNMPLVRPLVFNIISSLYTPVDSTIFYRQKYMLW